MMFLLTQRAIVAEIEVEQALVASNRELIRRMEIKVKAAIDRVWGTASPVVARPYFLSLGGHGSLPKLSR